MLIWKSNLKDHKKETEVEIKIKRKIQIGVENSKEKKILYRNVGQLFLE